MNKQEKINEVLAFIKQNKGKTKKFYAENNGVITNKTFYEWCKKGLIEITPTPTPTPTPTLIDDLLEEDDKEEKRKEKNRKYDYNR